ncbi:MAG: hypothetical protein HY347_02140, partial [candidate division NC10 bacterium]|nr:hypothetical protein [candidate division NC10 bacterium]
GMLDPLGSVLGAPLGPGPGDQLSGEWQGTYADNGGSGEIVFTLERKDGTLRGTWQLNRGGSGPFLGVLASGGRSFAFVMYRPDRECPGAFIGTAAVVEGRLVGAYQGSDCRGEVEGGRMDLLKR